MVTGLLDKLPEKMNNRPVFKLKIDPINSPNADKKTLGTTIQNRSFISCFRPPNGLGRLRRVREIQGLDPEFKRDFLHPIGSFKGRYLY